MKKLSWILALLLTAAACSPQVYPLYIDVRHPSSSGLKLSDKEIALVYMDGYNQVDSLFDRQAASALARSLEYDYFDGRERIGIYHIPSTDTVSLDLAHSLVMDTEGDVIFVLSSRLGVPTLESNQVVPSATSPDSAFVCPASVPLKTTLDVYDSMSQDRVYHYTGSAVLRPRVYNNGLLSQDALQALAQRSLAEEAERVGERLSARFVSTWVTENFSFYYIDNARSDEWIQALMEVMDGHMAAAIDIWSKLVKHGSTTSRACAAYNIAQAFFLLEDYELSGRWLAQAEKMENVSLAPGLRKRLASHL